MTHVYAESTYRCPACGATRLFRVKETITPSYHQRSYPFCAAGHPPSVMYGPGWPAPRSESPAERITRLQDQLRAAQAGLRRALDFRTASPEGLAIKAEVREALRQSGDEGPWGVREQF
jgi:hypothetical protein